MRITNRIEYRLLEEPVDKIISAVIENSTKTENLLQELTNQPSHPNHDSMMHQIQLLQNQHIQLSREVDRHSKKEFIISFIGRTNANRATLEPTLFLRLLPFLQEK